MAVEGTSLTPLACERCGGLVPLAAGERTRCPSCGSDVEIPSAYRELREAAQNLQAGRKEAAELGRALARVPSPLVRRMAMFDSAWFLFFGLGFWITAGVFVGVLVPPVVGQWFGVSTVDVFTEKEQGVFTMVLPLGTFALGLLGGGWARKRAIVRGGLQAALAARPPERPGGPQRCRQCGAAIALAADEHAVGCAYCGAVSLVGLPRGWIDRMSRHTVRLGSEIDAARKAWAEQRSDLRLSLILRGVAGVLIVGFPTIIVVASPDELTTYTAIDDAWGRPGHLPSWRAHRETSLPSVGFCKPTTVAIVGFMTRSEACDERGCRAGHRLVPLAHGETIRVIGTDLPEGATVQLQIHERTFFEDRWTAIEHAPIEDGVPVSLTASLSAWYRVELDLPGEQPEQIVRACIERAG